MTTIQYREQLVIFLEVLNAQVLLSQSRVDYYEALYGFKLAWADLERAVGGPFLEDTLPQNARKTGKSESSRAHPYGQ